MPGWQTNWRIDWLYMTWGWKGYLFIRLRDYNNTLWLPSRLHWPGGVIRLSLTLSTVAKVQETHYIKIKSRIHQYWPLAPFELIFTKLSSNLSYMFSIYCLGGQVGQVEEVCTLGDLINLPILNITVKHTHNPWVEQDTEVLIYRLLAPHSTADSPTHATHSLRHSHMHACTHSRDCRPRGEGRRR